LSDQHTYESIDSPGFRWARGLLAATLVAVVLAMLPLDRDTTGPAKWFVLLWGIAAAACAWTLSNLFKDRRNQPPNLLAVPLLLLLGLYVLAAAMSDFPRHSAVHAARMAAFIALYLLSVQIYREPRAAQRVYALFLLAVALSTLYALGQYIGIDPFPWAYAKDELYARLPGTLGNPNYAGHVLAPAVLVSLYFAWVPGRRWLALLAPFFLLHLAATGQRGGALALAAAAALFVFAQIARKLFKQPIRAVAAAMLATGLAGLAAASGIMVYTHVQTGSPFPLDESLLIRYNGYASAAAMVGDAPVLGYGPGNFVIENTPYWTPFEQRRFAAETEMNSHVHNDLLEFAVEAGVVLPIIVLFVLMLGMCAGLYAAFSHPETSVRRLGWLLACAFCASAVDGLFGFPLRLPVSAALFFLMLGHLDGVCWPAPCLSAGRQRLLRWSSALVALLSVGIAFHGSYNLLSHVMFTRGTNAALTDNLRRADAAFGAAEDLSPWDWEVPAERGVIRLAAEDYEDAAESFREAVADNPHIFFAKVNLAKSLFHQALAAPGLVANPAAAKQRLAMLEDARKHVDKALALCPMLSAALEMKGRIHHALATAPLLEQAVGPAQRTAHLQSAEKFLRQAVEQGAPNPVEIYIAVARICLALDRYEDAEEALNRAANIDPVQNDLWAAYAAAAEAQNDADNAQETLRYSLQQMQKEPEPDLRALAVLHHWQARLLEIEEAPAQEAAEAYQRALDLAPDRPLIWRDYLAYAHEHGFLERAKAHLQAAARELTAQGKATLVFRAVDAALDPQAPQWQRAAALLVEARDMLRIRSAPPSYYAAYGWGAEVIAKALQQYEASSAEKADIMLDLASVMAIGGEEEAALRYLDKIEPDLAGEERQEWIGLYAPLLLRTGHGEQALDVLRAEQVRSNDASLLILEAQIQAQLGALSASRRTAEAALERQGLDASERAALEALMEALEGEQHGALH
jgi:O-antigen ligase/predicted Zn-dependent protease